MNYKGIFLGAFLLPVVTMSYGKTVEAQIKEIEEAQLKKELEISDLGNLITERDKLLRCMQSECEQFVDEFIVDKKTKAKINGNILSQESVDTLIKEYVASVNEFSTDIEHALNVTYDIKDRLFNNIFYDDQDIKKLESLKFFLVRCTIERALIIKLVKKYQHCLQELALINKQIAHFNSIATV